MFLVVLHRSGPEWNPSLRLEEQSGWDEHAAFMDAVAAEGFVVLGGPLGEDAERGGDNVVHVVDAADEAEVRRRLSEDPWHVDGLLRIESVRPWSVWLRAS